MTKKLQALKIDDDTVIYVEAAEDVEIPLFITEEEDNTEIQRISKGITSVEKVIQRFGSLESTIKTYTRCTLNAFRDTALTNVKKVTLEFGVNVSGVSGIPYIASGTAGCNVKITVECAFSDSHPPAEEHGKIKANEDS